MSVTEPRQQELSGDDLRGLHAVVSSVRAAVESVVVGKDDVVRMAVTVLLAEGHLLVEDVPGVGKTLLAKALGRATGCTVRRVQFTPDLLPSDLTGVSVYDASTRGFEFKPGPVFANIVLADEINRTTPRTQSALLEAMSEEQVSVENETMPLERPFMVVATQNPFEFEGTYHLPENQLDRFLLKVAVGYPERASEQRILTTQPGRNALEHLRPVMGAREVVALQDRTPEVKLDASIVDYILDLVESTRGDDDLHLGVSPRGALALTQASQASALVNGRDYVTPDDVKVLFKPVCGHRVISKTYLHNGDANVTAATLQAILDRVATPA